MERINAKEFVSQAKSRLAGKDARKTALLHTGVTVGFALAVSLLSYGLELGIGNTGGLSGLGTGAILQTLQTILQWANTVLAPFWNLGFLYAALLWAGDRYARKGDLLTGFHRVGPCIGLLLNRMVLCFCVIFVCINVCSAAFMLTAGGRQLEELILSMGATGDYYSFMESLSQQQLEALLQSMLPLLIFSGVLSAVVLIPLLYRFRLAEFVILDHKGIRALPAMLISARLLHRRCLQMLKVDLRLWWYYGLKGLCMVLCYLDALLAAAGIALPTGDGIYFGIYVLYLAALLAVETAFRPQVETAYAGIYMAFRETEPARKPAAPEKPQNMPWDAE